MNGALIYGMRPRHGFRWIVIARMQICARSRYFVKTAG